MSNRKLLLTSVDDLLADLELCIEDLHKNNEEKERIDSAFIEKDNSIHGAQIYISPSTVGPKDKTFASISILPDAFGGWLSKTTLNFFGKKSIHKPKYYILANVTIYIFANDKNDTVYEHAYKINNKTKVKEMYGSKDSFSLSFEFQRTIVSGASMYVAVPITEEITVNKSYELQCRDRAEMLIWIECIEEVIVEVAKGRVAAKEIIRNGDENTSQKSFSGGSSYDEGFGSSRISSIASKQSSGDNIFAQSSILDREVKQKLKIKKKEGGS